MKRKLDSNDVPVPIFKESHEEIPNSTIEAKEPKELKEPGASRAPTINSFADLQLDTRLLQGVAAQNWSTPTAVQLNAIPLALKGRDILARAKTGTGKTAAYLLPIIHTILRKAESATHTPCISALILVPSRELADQVYKTIQDLTSFCAQQVRSINLTEKVSDAVQRSFLAQLPDIVVSTPARAVINLNVAAFSLANLAYLVIDEADLVLTYGHVEDMQSMAKIMPNGVQTILMSATLTEDEEVNTLKALFCRNPVTLKLEEAEQGGDGVTQYIVKCAEDEKFLLIYVIFKLKLIKGKCIVFVADVDRCYRLKLFLEQFGMKSCILNSELPVNSRIHVVEEFNKNVYDIIIASDENEMLGQEEDERSNKNSGMNKPKVNGETSNEVDEAALEKEPPKKKRKIPKRDKEYGVSRGIDFKNVACVLNFDLPTSSKSYTHRIGRTARAGQRGTSLSFVIPSNQYRKHKPTSIESTKEDEKVLAKIVKHQAKKGKEVKPYAFNMEEVEGFRYRMSDALRAVTRVAVREARTRELRQELIKSEKLKRHFEENPADLHHLRHDGELRPARVQNHMKHVPEYLMPGGGEKVITGDVGFVGIRKTSENGIRARRAHNRSKGKGKITTKKRDVLKSFKSKAGHKK